MMPQTSPELIAKYNVAGPRYTSYPTVPHWNPETFSLSQWEDSIRQGSVTGNISLYIHLPFCESLCTFCACHKRITKNHDLELPYIEAVLQEWAMYVRRLPANTKIEEIHLGGGSPSFFDPENLDYLVNGILRLLPKAENYEFSWEGNPQNTTARHLQVLYDAGFRRVSFGVQDYDPTVQTAINRLQSYETVETVTQLARQIGYTSVSHDLVFGLPFQTAASVQKTIESTLRLSPERLSFYSYAHVPWLKGNGQRGFREEDLPAPAEKRSFYETGKQLLEANDYQEVGMDHFALASDTLLKAAEAGTLHRNFMGYTTTKSKLLIGLGASAISDSWTMYAQNVKNIEEYQTLISAGQWPILKGHALSEAEQKTRRLILSVMCKTETEWTDNDAVDYEQLKELEKDGLIALEKNKLVVLPAGRPFLRNICMTFDDYYKTSSKQNMFSATI